MPGQPPNRTTPSAAPTMSIGHRRATLRAMNCPTDRCSAQALLVCERHDEPGDTEEQVDRQIAAEHRQRLSAGVAQHHAQRGDAAKCIQSGEAAPPGHVRRLADCG